MSAVSIFIVAISLLVNGKFSLLFPLLVNVELCFLWLAKGNKGKGVLFGGGGCCIRGNAGGNSGGGSIHDSCRGSGSGGGGVETVGNVAA